MDEQPLLAPIPEACRLLGGISRAKLYLLLHKGELEGRKIGTRRLVTRRSIDRLVEGDEPSDALS